jgi:hypothetical protein
MRRLSRVAVVGLVAVGGAVLPAASAGAAAPSAPPAQLCGEQNAFEVHYTAHYSGSTTTEVIRVPVTTRGGCASSWARGEGELSTAAIAGQCRTGIEPRLGPYPITIRFAQTHELNNRADCIELMLGISSGQIDPGRAPLFPVRLP